MEQMEQTSFCERAHVVKDFGPHLSRVSWCMVQHVIAWYSMVQLEELLPFVIHVHHVWHCLA